MTHRDRQRSALRRRAGLCVQCARPAVGRLCEEHRARRRELERRRKGAKRVNHCEWCGERGHYVPTCRKLREEAR